MDLLSIVWNADPNMLTLGPFTIRWYGILFAASFFFGYLLFVRFFSFEKIPMEELDALTGYMAIGTVLGARLGHCFFYEPLYYLQNPLEIIKVWHGGLASHGAAIGILTALWLFSRKYGRPYFWIVDRIVIVVALAGFFIRWGNFMNSEIYGRETSLPWGTIFERAGEVLPKHPTQIYEALAYLSIFAGLFLLYRKKSYAPPHALLFGLFLAAVFGFRFLVEFIKEPQVAFEASMTLNMGQLLSIPFVLAGIGLMIYAMRNQNQTASALPSRVEAPVKKGRKVV